MNNQHKMMAITSIKITEDVRDWINEVRQILRNNLQKPSLSQNETLRWMCVQTIGATNKIYQENHWRIHNTLSQTTEPLNIKRLYESVSVMREEEVSLKSKGTPEENP